ncbi:MAG: hypothetical protein K0U98_28085 [Deltaproteobacteria bacterium]|nr:hypothetical protein [Deltaproteobacteria bacterium]
MLKSIVSSIAVFSFVTALSLNSAAGDSGSAYDPNGGGVAYSQQVS